MAGFFESGGSFGNNFASGIADAAKNVGKSAGRAAKPVRKKKTSTQRNYQPVRNQSPQRNYQPARRTSQPRNYAAGGGGSAPRPPVGNTPAGTIAASVPPTPAPVSVDQFLANDTAYKSQQNAYQKALADYATQMAAEQGKYNNEYDAQTKQLGLDRAEGITNLRDDYASRGLVNSGVYADALGDLNTKFDTSAADLSRAKQAYLSDLTTGQTNFKTTQATLLEKARQEALQRRLDSMAK